MFGKLTQRQKDKLADLLMGAMGDLVTRKQTLSSQISRTRRYDDRLDLWNKREQVTATRNEICETLSDLYGMSA